METNFPFFTHGMDVMVAEYLLGIYNRLKHSFELEVDFDFSINCNSFQCFNGNTIDTGPVFKLGTIPQQYFLCFLLIGSENGRHSYNLGYQTWGYYKLKEDYGRILIKNETFLDRVKNLLIPIDVDFDEDKTFSKRFLVVTNDKMKAQLKLNQRLRDLINEINLKDFIIEINGYDLIIGNEKIISEETVFIFAEFLKKLARMF